MSEDNVMTELALLRDTVQTGFARMDRYFELQQAQHLELRAEVQQLNRRVDRIEGRLTALEQRLSGLEQRLSGLENEFSSFRDWAAGEFADVRLELRRLRQDVVNRDEELRRDVAALSQRVDRLERRLAEG